MDSTKDKGQFEVENMAKVFLKWQTYKDLVWAKGTATLTHMLGLAKFYFILFYFILDFCL